jgi:phosphoglycolate phosphatase-like HAD superfamily hydrolase
MTTDPLGLITDVNQQMTTLTGCAREDLIGTPFKNYFTDPQRAEEGIKLALQNERVTDYKLTALAKDGRMTLVSYNASIFRDAAVTHSLDVNGPFPELLDRFRESYFSFLPQTLRQNPGRVMPGMPEVLAALQVTPGAHLGLATGNFSLSARLKLEYYGLQRFFQTGGFGEDSDERAVAALASDAGPHSTFVIGDTPLDVAAALANGVVAVGVATGTFSAEALREAGAGLVFPDFSRWQDVMAALLG